MQVERSAVLEGSVEQVWSLLADFGRVADWHPFVAESKIEDGLSGRHIGAIRHLTLQDGGIIRETLLAMSDRERYFTYDILESPLPVENYVATLRLWPLSGGERCFAKWQVTFDTPPERAEEMETAVGEGIFLSGFQALEAKIAAGGGPR